MFILADTSRGTTYVHQDGTVFVLKEEAILYCFYKWKQEVLKGSGYDMLNISYPLFSTRNGFRFSALKREVIFIPSFIVEYTWGIRYIEVLGQRYQLGTIHHLFTGLLNAHKTLRNNLIVYDPYYIQTLKENTKKVINYSKLIHSQCEKIVIKKENY